MAIFDDVPKLIKDTVHSDTPLLAAGPGRALLAVAGRLRGLTRMTLKVIGQWSNEISKRQ